ncbi:MAG: TetR/AcrR family transcriptional regulator [Ilumatobacteraceae bacterium]
MGAKKKTPASSTQKVTAGSRMQLIDVTLRIILEQGVDAVRIEDIVAEVGVTKGSLYWHFEDREALIKEALAEHLRRLNAEIVEGVSTAISTATSKDDYLVQIAPFIVNPYDEAQVRERWQRLVVMAETRKAPELAAMMREVQSRSLAVFVELMSEAQKQGVLRDDVDPKAVATALSAMNLGSNIIDVLGDHGPEPEAWWSLMSFFIGALFPAGESGADTVGEG